jgi:pimeloyl-[acyl-carrier protein] methyl ester esterase
MDLAFIHGWGFDKNVWMRVTDFFPDHTCHLVELGFTGKPEDTGIPSNAVVIGHSLGVMWALRHAPVTIKGLVSIAGFDCFHRHVLMRDIRAMERYLETDPEKQMKSFYAACGYIPFFNIKTMNLGRLKQGLGWLKEWDERKMLKNYDCPVLALASQDDLIVPPDMSRDVWARYPLRMNDKGGHILPLTRPEWCAKNIEEFINAL